MRCRYYSVTLVRSHLALQAFSRTEIETTKPLVEDLKAHNLTLENIWKEARWLTDVVRTAREKNYTGKWLFSLATVEIGTHC